ncbi:MAG: helix-turn-helix transcriptional regulator [Porticoccus sp.]
MKIQDIRYHNLQALLLETGGNQAELARRTGTNAAYINQIINKSQLPSGKVRSVGECLARMLEQAFQKPEGWMDSETTAVQVAEPTAAYHSQSPDITKLIQIASKLSHDQIDMACRMLEGLTNKVKDEVPGPNTDNN